MQTVEFWFAHLFKGTCGLKQNKTQENTPFQGIFFDAPNLKSLDTLLKNILIYNSFFGTKNNRGCHRCYFGGRDSPHESLELIARALKCFLMTSRRGHGWMTQYPPQILPGGDFVLTVCPSN